MIFYLIDASVAVIFYKPKSLYKNKEEYDYNKRLLAQISKQKLSKKATIFIPSFCIGEVRNILAKWYYRYKNVFTSKQDYDCTFGRFISHVHDRNFFYSYDLNRYHNINTTEVIEVEHTTETEFDKTDLPVGTVTRKLNQKLRETNPNDHVGNYYLSALDVLIIAMGMELKRIHAQEVHLLTGDKRLCLIASKKTDIFPKPYHWHWPELKDLGLPI